MGKEQFKLAIDTGGTFTDVCMLDKQSGNITITKVPSTPQNPAIAVIDGIKNIIKKGNIFDGSSIDFLIHGTTVATNALLELKGAKTALITTENFKDILLIGRQNRPELYSFGSRRSDPIIPRDLVFEVPERISYLGEILKPINKQIVKEIAKKINFLNIESIAVCLLHSYINPEHEKIIKKVMTEECPGKFLTVSSEVLPEFREYERASTIAINAYVMPKVSKYIGDLDNKIKNIINSNLYIMQSNGGVITAKVAKYASSRTILSGPAGGALGAVTICEQTKINNVISIDIGGTSADICLINNKKARYSTMNFIGDYPIKLPMIDIHTIGAGGGSIAWVDSGGALKVGPQSAGAVPGPVCYQKGGTRPTVSDANLILGRLNPDYILGGKMKMDFKGAYNAIKEQIADPLNLSVDEAAIGIIKVVNANMVRGIRVVSVEKGYDPRDFALLGIGGAGPLHVVEIAKELAMKKVIVSVHPGIASAVGMLSANVRHDFVQTYIKTIDCVNEKEINEIYKTMEEKAIKQLKTEGFLPQNMSLIRNCDVRYKGQSYELLVSVPNNKDINREVLKETENSFANKHKKLYGYCKEKGIVEVVNLRLIALGKFPKISPLRNISKKTLEIKPVSHRKVYFEGKYQNTPIYNRNDFLPGCKIEGPAIIEQLDSTIFVLPNILIEAENHGNIIMNLEEENKDNG